MEYSQSSLEIHCGVFIRIARIAAFSVALSSCALAAAPLTAAFIGARSVENLTGASVGVRFGSMKGKQQPPEPLPMEKSVAVWPEDEGNVMFANDLQKAGKFSVTPPDKVLAILDHAHIKADPKMLTDQEMNAAFAVVCNGANTDLIFASKSREVQINHSMLSLSAPTETSTADLMAYSCQKHAVIWRDTVHLIMKTGTKKISSKDEVNESFAKAWQERIDEAMDSSKSKAIVQSKG